MGSRVSAIKPVRQYTQRSALPGVTMLRLTLGPGLSRAIPARYGSVVYLEGSSIWSVSGAEYSTRAGMVGVKVPGEVYAERRRAGQSRFEVVVYDDVLIEEARETLGRRLDRPRAHSVDSAQDARALALLRLHRAMGDDASTGESLEQALTEALAALVELTNSPSDRSARSMKWGDAVRRARALLDDQLLGTVTLDELAAHARLDKFRLCRAFREQIGLPPYAYLTHRRVSLAQELLGRGVPQAEVAMRVGLYDQSQLHRHFKRILGLTPGEFTRAVRSSATTEPDRHSRS